ncbi:MAG: glycosyltransferase [Paracoccaceae bacterium]|nr:MAG: glycosyltransferase [Paracoccaceae bacterium]
MAVADPDVEATLLAGIDGRMFPGYGKVGSAITALPDSPNEFLLVGHSFDDFYHTIYDARRNKALRRFLEDVRPDVIHIHHSLWVGLEFLQLARQVLPDVRIIYTLHEYLPICLANGQLYRRHEAAICLDTSPDQCVRCFPDRSVDDFVLRRRGFRRAFALVDHFIAPSEYLRQRFIAWGIAPDRISTIANGHKSCRPTGWVPSHSPGVATYGFFGQYVDAKGIDVLLQAASTAAREIETRIEIKIHGGNKQYASEPYLKRIEAIMAEMPENVQVTEAGSYARENVFELMAAVDWMVMPSVWPETFGLVISEAWDARRPILGARAGGITNRIIDGVNGLSFAPGATGQLAGLIVRTAGNAELWTKLSTGVADEISMDQAWAEHRSCIAALPGAA